MVKRASDASAVLGVDDFLHREHQLRERGSKVGYEYVAGEAYAMSPNSHRHSRVIFNIMRQLDNPARARSCQIFSDVLTKVAEDRYYYPDVVITCAPLDPRGVILSPCFVVEVTSPSTRTTDLREKPTAYRSCAAVQGILIAEQNRRHVVSYSRVSHGEWSRSELTGSGECDIPCIGARLTLDEIYETLDFPKRVKEGDEFTTEEYGREWVLVPAHAVS